MVKVGDNIKFLKEPDLKESVEVCVRDLVHFDTFEDMIGIMAVDKLGFVGETKESVLRAYRSFYSEEDEAKYGVLAIRVCLEN